MARETRSASKPAAAEKKTPVVAQQIEKPKEEKKQPTAVAQKPAAPSKPLKGTQAPISGKAAPKGQKPLKSTKTMLAVTQQGQEYLDQMQERDEAKQKEEEAKEKAPTPSKAAQKQVTPKQAEAESKQTKAASKSRSPVKDAPAKQSAPKKGDQKEDKDPKDAQQSPKKDTTAASAPVSSTATAPKKEEEQQEAVKGKEPLPRTGSRIGLQGGPTAGLIDVVFCCDTTGSMGSYLSQSKEAVKTIVNKIQEKCKGEDISVQFGFVAYRDHPPQELSYVTKIKDLVDREEILKYIETLDAAGGGDGPEAVMDGLMQAAQNMTWRNTQKLPTLRYIFHICDAPPHGTLYSDGSSTWKDGCPCGITIEKISHVVNIFEIHYRLIKASSHSLEKMGQIFKEKFTNYEETTLSNAKELDVRITDMIIRELCPDMDYDIGT